MGKINIYLIVVDHFLTLRDYRTNKTSKSDITVFFGLPVAAAFLVWWKGFNFDSSILNAMLSAFSIFAGLLLNLLVLLVGYSGNAKFIGTDPATVTRRVMIRQMHENISFSILVAILVVVFALAGVCEMKFFKTSATTPDVAPALSIILTILLVNFLLTLLMVLKRIHVLLSFEFKTPNIKNKHAA